MSDNDQLDVLIAVYLIRRSGKAGLRRVRGARDRTARSIPTASRSSSRTRRRGARRGDRRPPRPEGRRGRSRRRPRPRALRSAAPGRDRRRRRRRGGWPGSSRSTGSRAGSGRRWTTCFPPGSAGSSRSTTMAHAELGRHEALGERDPELDRADRQGVKAKELKDRPRRGRGRPGRRLIVDVAGGKHSDRGFVVVTGTSTGIGAATALHLAENGLPRLRRSAERGGRRGDASASPRERSRR